MYKSYRAYTGLYPKGRTGVDETLDGINGRGEKIVSVTGVGEDNLHVLIITETMPQMITFNKKEMTEEEKDALAESLLRFKQGHASKNYVLSTPTEVDCEDEY